MRRGIFEARGFSTDRIAGMGCKQDQGLVHQLIGMVVQDALHIGTCFIDRRVHRRLAVGLAETFELVSLSVNDD